MTTIQRIRLGDLAARLGCELHGDPEIEITGVAGMERAGPTELTFLANPKYAPKVKHTRAGAILVKQPLDRAAARQPDLRESLSRFCPRSGLVLSAAAAEARHSSASLDSGHGASIGEGASIGRVCRGGRAA